MSRCPDALACDHAPTAPADGYLSTRVDVEHAATRRSFPGWPSWHLAAILRARLEYPGRAREARRLEAVQAGMRRADRWQR
jgi:hypothetical protein